MEKQLGNAFFVVQANAVAGQDAELNRWYDEQHFDDCLACDSAVAAQRFKKVSGTGPGAYDYLALYEVQDPQTFAENRRSKEGTPLLPRTAALALPAHAFFYRPILEQPGLLAKQERSSVYIEFLEAGSCEDAVSFMMARQRVLEFEVGLAPTELMVVDNYQERQGWHADGIIFAEVSKEVSDAWYLALSAPAGAAVKVVEAGLYRSISPRKIRLGSS